MNSYHPTLFDYLNNKFTSDKSQTHTELISVCNRLKIIDSIIEIMITGIVDGIITDIKLIIDSDINIDNISLNILCTNIETITPANKFLFNKFNVFTLNFDRIKYIPVQLLEWSPIVIKLSYNINNKLTCDVLQSKLFLLITYKKINYNNDNRVIEYNSYGSVLVTPVGTNNFYKINVLDRIGTLTQHISYIKIYNITNIENLKIYYLIDGTPFDISMVWEKYYITYTNNQITINYNLKPITNIEYSRFSEIIKILSIHKCDMVIEFNSNDSNISIEIFYRNNIIVCSGMMSYKLCT